MINHDVFTEFPTIRLNNGIILRQPLASPNDPFLHFECSNDPLITPFLPDSCIPKSVEDARADLQYLLNLFHKKDSLFWVIADAQTNQYIGNIGFHEWDKINNGAEIAYEVDSRYWSRGIATLAIGALTRFAFLKMGTARIQATTLTHNERSMKVLRKNNFRLEGVLRQYKYHKGEFVDVAMFGYARKQFARDAARSAMANAPLTKHSKAYMAA